MSRLIDLADIAPLEMRPGLAIARRIEGERITMAVFELQPGTVVPEHKHPAEQMGSVRAPRCGPSCGPLKAARSAWASLSPS